MTSSTIRFCFAIALAAPLLFGGAAAHAQTTGEMFKGFQSDEKGPVNVEADALDVQEKGGQRVSTFSGNVTVTRGDSVLKAGKIAIYSSNDKPADGAKPAPGSDVMPGAGSFTRIEASGKVYVNSGDQTATGDVGVVDMLSKQVTMTGNVVLSQGPNVITGDKLTWDMTTGKARVDQKPGGRIRGVFTPGATPGAPGAPTAPAAPAKTN